MATRSLAGTASHSHAISSPSHQAYRILHFAFSVTPIVAGLDKFGHVLVDWERYLSPAFARAIPMEPRSFMFLVGLLEVAVGLFISFRPRYGGYVLAAWLWAIIANLLAVPGFYDIALRDFGLSLGAIALARLALAEETT